MMTKVISSDSILVIYFVIFPMFSMEASILNISSLADSNKSDNSSIPDQDASDSQQFANYAVHDFNTDVFNLGLNTDIFNHGSANTDVLNHGSVNTDVFNHGSLNMDLFNHASHSADLINHAPAGSIGGEQHYPPLDLKMWEAIPLMNGNSQLAPYLQPPNTQLIDLGNLHGYDHHTQGADVYDDAGYNDLEQGSPYYGKPNFGSLFGGSYKGGLRTPFPRHKLKKLIRQHRHPGLFRKHRGYGNYFGDSGSYIGDLAHHLTSLYQPFIPKFTPFPINFPNIGSGGGFNELELFKAILIPLAGVALMGAAATTMLVTNPFIWTLPFSLLIGPSTFGHFFGRRRRRNAESGVDKNVISEVVKKKIEEIKVLDDFLKKTSKEEVIMQEKKVLATYLMTQSVCLDRLVCSLHRPNLPDTMVKEGRVMNIVTKEILENEFVPQIIHDNILRARQVGLASGNCQTFLCQPVNYWAHQKR